MEEKERIQLELASFRQQWHDEIQHKQETEEQPSDKPTNEDEQTEQKENEIDKTVSENSLKSKDTLTVTLKDNLEKEKEEKAAKLFLKGIQKEREKLMYEAIYFYKQAVHLVPDIESRVADYQAKFSKENDDSSDEDDETEEIEPDYQASAELEAVTKQFKTLGVGDLCSQEFPSKQTHISVLPSELLIYILRWVVSDELDLRSLEQVSLVCKWFYACARDESVWRTACLRVWGVHCGTPSVYDGCWRRMLLERPHLHFNGVYISKNSYVRAGEQSLDSYYRPFHYVEYFRYLRFYSDGTVLVCTTPDDPTIAIPALRKKQETTAVNRGHYRLVGDAVNIITKKIQKSQSETRNRRRQNPTIVQEHVFHMELKLRGTGRRRNNQLHWGNYSYLINNKSSGLGYTNQIDVQNFKPFFFSRVKSFHSVSTAPL